MDEISSLAKSLMVLDDKLASCMKCGFCQAFCPVFDTTGKEGDVTRGKIALVENLAHLIIQDPEAVNEAVPLPAVRRVPVQLPFRRADAGNLYGSAGHRHGLSGIVPGQEGHFQKASSQPARGGYAPARRFAVPETALER
mgnify:CR=1 FL=1